MSVLKASVVIPTYKYPEVVDCLDILSKDKYPDFEVVIVDDGSGDDSVDVIKRFIKGRKDFRLIILSKNSGPAVARNRGARESKGDVILFTDSDCKPCNGWVSKMMKPFVDLDITGVCGTYRTWNSKSMVARFVGYEIALRHERMAKRKYIDFIGTFSAGYRRDIFLAEGGFDEKFRIASGEDTELSYRLASKGCNMVFIKDAWVYHRHPDNVSWYLKQKLGRGKWRVRLYSKHSSKMKGESYTPFTVLVQIPLFFVSVATILFSPLIGVMPFISSFVLIFALNIFEGARMMKFEKVMIVVAPVLLTLRTVASGLGVMMGLIWRRHR